MRGTFVSVARRTCATVLMGYLFWSTLRPVFSKAIRTVVCINFVHQVHKTSVLHSLLSRHAELLFCFSKGHQFF